MRPTFAIKYYHSQEEQLRIIEQEKISRARRSELAKRNSILMRKKREQKKIEFKEKLTRLLNLQKKREEIPFNKRNSGVYGENRKLELEDEGFSGEKELDQTVFKMRLKMGMVSKEELEEKRYGLLRKRDEDLSEKERKMKKYQRMQKINADKRKERKDQAEKLERQIEEMKERNPGKYLQGLKKKRKNLKSKIKRIKVKFILYFFN